MSLVGERLTRATLGVGCDYPFVLNTTTNSCASLFDFEALEDSKVRQAINGDLFVLAALMAPLFIICCLVYFKGMWDTFSYDLRLAYHKRKYSDPDAPIVCRS